MRRLDGPTIRWLTLVGGVLVVACSDSTGPGVPPHPRVRLEWVAGSAATGLNQATGLFEYSDPAISPMRRTLAESVAVAYVRRLMDPGTLQTTVPEWESVRGGPIGPAAALRPCARTLPIPTVWGPMPGSAPLSLRRFLSPFWSMTLCGADGRARVAVALADAPLTVGITNGLLDVATWGQLNNGLDADGIPVRLPFGLSFAPEEFVAATVPRLGRRVTQVPDAILSWDYTRWPGYCPTWRLRFESDFPVTLEESGAVVSTTELFARRVPGCFSDTLGYFLPVGPQPSGNWFYFPKDSSLAPDSVFVSLSAPSRFGRVRLP